MIFFYGHWAAAVYFVVVVLVGNPCSWESMCLWIKSICQKIHKAPHTQTSAPSQHLIKLETAHIQTNLRQSEGLAEADCSSHDSGGCDSLPYSPHPSALHKDLPCGQGSEAPQPLFTPSLWHWPPTLCFDYFGKMRWLTSSQQLQLGTDLHTGPEANSSLKLYSSCLTFLIIHLKTLQQHQHIQLLLPF